MSALAIRLEAWPLFVTVLPRVLRDADVDAYIADVNRLYQRRERFASLIDARGVTDFPGASLRKRLTDWQNETIELIRRDNVTTATVVTSPAVRGALTAMNWVFRPPNEQVAVATFAEGLAHCVRALARDGRPVDAAVRRLAEAGTATGVEDVVAALRRASSVS